MNIEITFTEAKYSELTDSVRDTIATAQKSIFETGMAHTNAKSIGVHTILWSMIKEGRGMSSRALAAELSNDTIKVSHTLIADTLKGIRKWAAYYEQQHPEAVEDLPSFFEDVANYCEGKLIDLGTVEFKYGFQTEGERMARVAAREAEVQKKRAEKSAKAKAKKAEDTSGTDNNKSVQEASQAGPADDSPAKPKPTDEVKTPSQQEIMVVLQSAIEHVADSTISDGVNLGFLTEVQAQLTDFQVMVAVKIEELQEIANPETSDDSQQANAA